MSNEVVPRKPNGQLLPGHPPLPGGGRPKGRKNTKTLTMLQMMQAAAVEKHGSVDAFLATVMDQDPVFFAAQMIRATVPAAKEPDPAAVKPTVVRINIQPIAAGTFVSREAHERLLRTGQLPPDALITLIEPGATTPEIAAPATSEDPAESDALALRQGERLMIEAPRMSEQEALSPPEPEPNIEIEPPEPAMSEVDCMRAKNGIPKYQPLPPRTHRD